MLQSEIYFLDFGKKKYNFSRMKSDACFIFNLGRLLVIF